MKQKMREIFSIHGDTAEYSQIHARIVDGGQVTGTNLCILMLAILIASIGLNMNSTAVIIGAMLISPLMGSIQAMGYGVATADAAQFRKSSVGFLFQIAICLVTSTVYFLLSPISTQTSELLARTQPNIWDVLIAACGGLAGMIGVTRKEKSNVIPGVAIATALMPPLCTCGYGIAHGNWRIALGAGFLFLVNAYFIFLTSVLVLLALRVPRQGELSPQQRRRMKRNLTINTVLIMIPCLVVAGYMVRQANADSTAVTGFETSVPVESVTEQMKTLFPSVQEVQIGSLESVGEDGALTVQTSAVVYLEQDLPPEDAQRLEQWLQQVYDGGCRVIYITQGGA